MGIPIHKTPIFDALFHEYTCVTYPSRIEHPKASHPCRLLSSEIGTNSQVGCGVFRWRLSLVHEPHVEVVQQFSLAKSHADPGRCLHCILLGEE